MSQWDDAARPNSVSRWVAGHITVLLWTWGFFGVASVVFLVIAHASEGWSPAVWSTLTAIFAVVVTMGSFRRIAIWVERYDRMHVHDLRGGDVAPGPAGDEQ